MNHQKFSDSQPLVVDWKQEEASSLVLPKPPTLSSPSQILSEVGIGFNFYTEPAHKVPESYYLQHILIVSFGEGITERSMDGKKRLELSTDGSVVLIPAQVNNKGATYKSNSFALLLLEPKLLANCLQDLTNTDIIQLIPTFAQLDPLINGIAKSIKADFDLGIYDQLYIESLFQTLSIHLCKRYTSKTSSFKEYAGGLPPYQLKQAINFINDNLDQKIKINDIAQLLDISQYYFCRLFRDSTGVSPYQYVIQQRIVKAKSLIKNSKLPLADIAYRCGFSSQSQMTQHFRKCVGVTPKVYKNQL